jgi:hypothetical protein
LTSLSPLFAEDFAKLAILLVAIMALLVAGGKVTVLLNIYSASGTCQRFRLAGCAPSSESSLFCAHVLLAYSGDDSVRTAIRLNAVTVTWGWKFRDRDRKEVKLAPSAMH